MFWNAILIAALVGVIGAVIGKIWDGSHDFLAGILSYFISAIGMGIILFGIMGIGYFVGIFGSWHIFGCHPFLIGFIFGVVREIYFLIRSIVG